MTGSKNVYRCPECNNQMAQVVVSTPMQGDVLPDYPYRDRLVWWCPICKVVRGEIDVNISSGLLNRISNIPNELRGDNRNG